MVELNQNEKSKRPYWPDALRKVYFTEEINKQQIQAHKCLQVSYRIVVLKV